jgi:predicted GIY-YIG superfamily endonuclease
MDQNEMKQNEIQENMVIEPSEEAVKGSKWFCDLLVSEDGATYVGATVDPDRRLRQHNGLIKGGAKATARKPGAWRRMCYVKGFPDNHAALQFEWRWKSLSRKKVYDGMEPVQRRLEALRELMAFDRPTSKAVPYSQYLEFEVVYG